MPCERVLGLGPPRASDEPEKLPASTLARIYRDIVVDDLRRRRPRDARALARHALLQFFLPKKNYDNSLPLLFLQKPPCIYEAHYM